MLGFFDISSIVVSQALADVRFTGAGIRCRYCSQSPKVKEILLGLSLM